MTSALLRACIICGEPGEGSRCSAHRLPDRRRRRRPQYGATWGRLSKRARSLSPLCAKCGTGEALQVHHLDHVADVGPDVPSLDGVRVLCQACHADEHEHMRPSVDPGGRPSSIGVLHPPGEPRSALHTLRGYP